MESVKVILYMFAALGTIIVIVGIIDIFAEEGTGMCSEKYGGYSSNYEYKPLSKECCLWTGYKNTYFPQRNYTCWKYDTK